MTAREIAEFAEVMREQGIAQLRMGDVVIQLGPVPIAPTPEVAPAAPEERSPLTNLTPSEEAEWFHSS